jgi:hypothetical protein
MEALPPQNGQGFNVISDISNPRFRLLYFSALLTTLNDKESSRIFAPLAIRVHGIYFAAAEHGVFVFTE